MANKQGIGTRLKSFFGFGGAEGSVRGPFYGWGELGGSYSLGYGDDGFQRNLELSGHDASRIPAAYAAVMANARAISQCHPQHRVTDASGNTTISKTSPASRILRRPNSYESWPQFITNMIAEMQFEGEAFAVAVRDNRGAIVTLHKLPRRGASPYTLEDGSIMYSVGSNPMEPDRIDYMVPADSILHLRSHSPRHPLIGESPVKAAAMAAGINVALSGNQLAFYSRMSRPSGILHTDSPITEAQMSSLRDAWKDHSQRLAAGGIPILHSGLKFQSLSIDSQDAQLIEAQRLSIEEIARVFGVPLPVIGDLSNATFNNVENLVSLWLSISLNALIENIERALDHLFALPQNERIELDVTALIRLDYGTRIDSVVKAIQGGLMTPNEGRQREGLNPIEFGDQAYLQAQMVPMGLSPLPPEASATEPEPAHKPEERMNRADVEKHLRLVINGD